MSLLQELRNVHQVSGYFLTVIGFCFIVFFTAAGSFFIDAMVLRRKLAQASGQGTEKLVAEIQKELQQSEAIRKMAEERVIQAQELVASMDTTVNELRTNIATLQKTLGVKDEELAKVRADLSRTQKLYDLAVTSMGRIIDEATNFKSKV